MDQTSSPIRRLFFFVKHTLSKNAYSKKSNNWANFFSDPNVANSYRSQKFIAQW